MPTLEFPQPRRLDQLNEEKKKTKPDISLAKKTGHFNLLTTLTVATFEHDDPILWQTTLLFCASGEC